jgi:choline/glycine/proline betaine transport protein
MLDGVQERLGLGFSRFGHIRLGPDHSRPEYSYPSWFAMLFGAGMGIGVLFWSVAEPVSHYLAPARAQPDPMQAAREAVTTTYLHWGLHGWGVYVVVGLSLAYFAYRHDLPLWLRSALLGRDVHQQGLAGRLDAVLLGLVDRVVEGAVGAVLLLTGGLVAMQTF